MIGTLAAVGVLILIVVAASVLRSGADESAEPIPVPGFTPATISALPGEGTSRAEIDQLSPQEIAGAALDDRGKVSKRAGANIPKGAQSLARQAEGLAGSQPFDFVLTSFNVLGSQHTRAGKNAQRFASGQARARAAGSLIASYGSSVVGMQELQRDQLAVLAAMAGDRWEFYPGTALGGPGVPQSLMWDTAVWEPTFTGTITIPFMGTTRPQPIVRLRHQGTNREIYVLNVHNSPRDRQGRENERDKAEQIEIAAVQELRKDKIPVFVIGDFNGWDGSGSSMRTLGNSGIWEIFLPGVSPGALYKFNICYVDGSWNAKADPMARATEVPPATASVVTESTYQWGDGGWMAARAETNPHTGPLSVYEVHLGSWRKGLSYRELADELVDYVSSLGFTHVELLPVAEHPYGPSWGYQVTSYYAPTSRFGTPDEFRYLVDALHRADIGVILDWVPAHFPKDSWALAKFDGTPLYEHPDPLRGEHTDWGTLIFDFGRPEVRNFLVANALYWLEEFHIDGLRVDAVASMLYLDYSRQPGQWRPNVRGGRENLEAIEFIQETTATAYRRQPGIIMMAEESTAWPGVTAPTSVGGLGFGLKWNMGWMNDTLRYLAEAPINRRYHHGGLTFSLVYAFSEQFILPLSHDEVVHGKGSLLQKMPGDRWQQLAGLRALFAYQWTHPGKKLLFMGSEFGQEHEWAESQSIQWEISSEPGHAGISLLIRDLNALYLQYPALWAEDFTHAGFTWLVAGDGDHNVIAYLRQGDDSQVAVVVNFSGTPHENYRLPLPHEGTWREVLNTDAPSYGGSGVGNLGSIVADQGAHGGFPASALVQVPPLGAVIFAPGT